MKRNGRQLGTVRGYGILPSTWNPKRYSRFINCFDSPPTAGFFTKVDPSPTNHSKLTGKCDKPRCNECHMHPSRKSKHKTKGTHKLKSYENAVHEESGLNLLSGISVSGGLDHLDNEEPYYFYDEDVNDDLDDDFQ